MQKGLKAITSARLEEEQACLGREIRDSWLNNRNVKLISHKVMVLPRPFGGGVGGAITAIAHGL